MAERVPYRELERRDGQLQRLQQMENLARYVAERNAEAVQQRRVDGLLSMPFDFLLEDARRFPIEVTRQGEIVSRDLTTHAFLPHREDLRVVPLTRGDLDAAAEWDMLPALPMEPGEIDKVRPFYRREGAYQALGTVSRLESNVILSVIDRLQHQRIHDLYEANSQRRLAERVEPPSVGDLSEREMTAELRTILRSSRLEQYMERPEQLAERVALTLMARLGSRMVPNYEMFRSDVSEDLLSNVDLLARTHDLVGKRSWITGLDVTIATDQDVIARKQRRLGPAGNLMEMHDPETRHLTQGQKTLLHLRGYDWPHMLQLWEQRRGNTTITPEYFLRYDHRRELASQAIGKLRQLSGDPLYSYESIRQVYTKVYGRFDPPGQHFGVPDER